ncbi:unnamed protein product [Calicophoron daubneyi]|uniref:Uncharacterized protein n=1 Tax=Calicophoron daubneyi TaxID=300641 RepID=A0AAV2T8Q2_CALDB
MTHSQTIWCVHVVLGWVDGRVNCMKDSLAGWHVARVARSLAANGANGAVVGRSHAFEQRTVINPETRLETIPLRLPHPFARVELMWFHSSPAWLLLLVLGTIIYSSDGFNPLFLFDNRLIETEHGQKAELSLNSKEERLRLHLRHPIPIYGRLVEEITVFRNGLIALDDSSAENVPRNYPADTVHTGERLQELDGRYFSVFSTVNDGLKGSVTVREIDQSENLSLGCVNTKQIERFLLIIRKSYPLDEGFQWKSILSVTWANVTNSAQSMDKVNSYTVIIFTDGVHSYSFIQYWDINWPEKGVISSGALPPEAGIFMRPLGGYQLPRSNHSVDVELWSDESNVASPGEWLVPLSELPITSDEIVRSLPEMYTQFLESLENACGFGPHLGPEEVSATDFTNSEILTEVMNDSPKDKQLHESTEPAGWYSEDYSDEDDDSLYASELPAPTISTEQQTEITDEVHGSTDALIASETEIVYEPSTQLPQGVYDEDESRFYKTESTIIPKTVLPLDETQLPGIHSQPNEYPANYPERSDYYTSTYSQSVERCDASVECADPHSECHRFAGVSCCICREGYYGSGKSHCWREDTDHKFAFNGSLNTHLESAGRPLTLTAYVDVQHGAVGRSSSGVRGGHPNDPVYQTIRILTPMFHILNSLISSSCPNNTGGQANDVPEYSLFTLSGGLRSTLVLQFFFDIEHVGRLTATCRFRLDVDSNSVYSRGSIQIDVTKSETIALISRPYREAQGVTGEGNKSYYAKYYIDQYGRIVFPGESVRFVAEQRATDELEAAKDELMVHWTGVADVQHESTDDYSSSCLLQSGSPIPRTHSFYIRLKDRGYCSEDCSAQDGSCNLFCVDEPLLFSHEPNSCDCVHCEHAGEHCVTDGATYHCTCKPGLRRMDDKSCQADTPVPDVPYIKEQCGSVQCHPHARCIQPEQGFCQCLPGYRGDGIRRCDDDPCSRCRRNEVCTGDACVPSGANLCDGVQCGRNAFCHDGACVCTAGYTGDPRVECIEERDQCEGIRCHQYGYCDGGRCLCHEGYEGDGYWECKPKAADLCANVQCHPYARCESGNCKCIQGYHGDGYRECRQGDPCDGVRCHENGYCQEGMCYCRDGYRGDGYRDCRLVQDDPCANVRCHPMARCHNGECRCEDGYTGDGVRDCVRITRDPCDGVRCHENGYCQEGMCYCRDGYRGDGYRDCRLVQDDPCANVRCHPMARCHNGECRCEDGYTGDGVRNCTRPAGDLCAGVQCHRFGQCYENRCYCSHGYVGDGVNFCDPRTEDPCQGVRCADHAHCDGGRCSCDQGYEGDGHSECRLAKDKCADVQCHERAQCYDGRCRCLDGYEGDGYYECKTSVQDPCSQVQCHQYAECRGGQCHCLLGYEGDGYYDCRPVRSDPCTNVRCHAYATCQGGVCRCRYGYEGDGYYYCRPVQRKPDRSHCDNCRGIPYKELAQCVDGRCTCTPGFVEAQPGLCVECVQDNCHRDALCMPNKEYNGAYSCQCKPGFTGNGISDCHQDGPGTSPVDRTCGGGCRVRNAECNPSNGTCVCRRGYDGDGQYSCIWNCQLCLPNAICDRENEGCTCQPGYYGDGKTYCEPIPTTPAPVKVTIAGQGQTLRLTDLDRPLELRCYVSARDDSITGQWIQPKGSQQARISVSRLSNGTEVLLYIARPVLTDVGLYICRAGQNEAHIEVAIDETALPYDIYLTSDDGILRVRSGGQNTTTAAVWNIAENNKYGPVSLAADCNSKRLIYTSDYGNTIRWGETDGRHKASVTHRLFTSQMSRFRHLAVDPPSGNIFAWDEGLGNIVLLNPNKPDMRYTLEKITSLRHDTAIRFAGLAVHSTKGLLYWAMFADGWMPNGTIQVASMTGENEKQVIQLSGEPLALSLSPLVENSGASTGRLCWIQRSITNTFALITELYCGRLSADGRSLLMQERVRQYRASEEPSWGLIHHGNTVLWTDATRTMYFSANPSRSVRVRHVCCSNRFQSIAVLANCQSALNNACGFSNGRCRYFCLPGDQLYRTCVCPDGEPGCHKEI